MLDDDAAATIERHFHEDMAHCREIRLEEFRQRGVMDRLKELACYAVWRVL